MRIVRMVVLAMLGLSGGLAGVALSQTADRGGVSGAALTNDQASGGLKEALTRGISTAVASTGKPGGYFENPAIKILMPPKLRTMEQGMRAAAMGGQVDALVKSMNEAAEQAAPAAKSISLTSLKQMRFTDARGVVTGDRMAGTEYFKRTTAGKIQTAFRPIVEAAMAKTGVATQLNAVLGSAPKLPFGKTPAIDINQYVLNKATDGLFVVVGQEEVKIRTDPAAQATLLLRTVFGR